MINDDFMFKDRHEDYSVILQELRAGKAKLIDIRERNEWAQLHFKCAMHILLSDLTRGKGMETLREIKRANRKIYIHCRSGTRAQKAHELLEKYGCRETHVIPISMMKIIEEGYMPTT